MLLWRASLEVVNKFGRCRVKSFYSPTLMADSDSNTIDIFDSLPYYDNDLEQDPTLREKVERELARHQKNPTTLHPRVPPAYQLFTVGLLYVSSSRVFITFLRLEKPSTSGRD